MYYILGFISTGVGGRYDILIYLLFFIIGIYMILKRKIIIPKEINLLLIVLFSVSYTIISSFYQDITFFLLLGPIVAYYSGIIIIQFCKKDNVEEYVTKCIYAICIGLFIHAMLNFMINVGSESRNTTDFWTGEIMSATLQGTLLTPILSLIFFTIVFVKKKIVKIIMIICFILAISYDMIIATRSVLIISALILVLDFIIYMAMNKKIKNKLKVISILLISTVIILVMYNNNVFNIKSSIEQTNMYSRIGQEETESSDNKRFEAQIEGIKQIFEFPFGVQNNISSESLKYAHNMWLDVARQAGIIPFIILIMFFISNIYSLIRIIKNKNIMVRFKILLISIYSAFILMFLVEPILQAIPIIFVIFCIIAGFIDSISKKEEVKL